MANNKYFWLWIIVFFSVLTWSAINPASYFTWALEVAPALIASALLLISYARFQLTPLLYSLILIHCIILMVGGHYTYAEVPLFDWLSQVMEWPRNNYDKLGHFAQGFVPAIVAREILLRRNVLHKKSWLWLFVISICLAFSAFYELIEWWVAIFSGESAEDFLGTQGYQWDTQSDMLFALIGAIAALVFLSGLHNKQLTKLSN